ncbi:MAG TPA: hypothetical protein VGC21_21535 [Telluria sp.]|jgi:hypothetical protein
MTKTIKGAAPAEPLPIPNPPSGGSWKWNEATREWVENQPEVKPEDKTQE